MPAMAPPLSEDDDEDVELADATLPADEEEEERTAGEGEDVATGETVEEVTAPPPPAEVAVDETVVGPLPADDEDAPEVGPDAAPP